MVLTTFLFCLTLSVLKKWNNSIFKTPIIPQTLNISRLQNHKCKVYQVTRREGVKQTQTLDEEFRFGLSFISPIING